MNPLEEEVRKLRQQLAEPHKTTYYALWMAGASLLIALASLIIALVK